MPIPNSVKNASLGGLMQQQAASGAPSGGDGDDSGSITCPNCGAGFQIQKQTSYQAGPVTTPPDNSGASAQPAGASAGGGMPPTGAM